MDMYVEAARKYTPGADIRSEEVEEIVSRFSPLGRVGVPEDVSRVLAFW
jgi:hypothetical protein